ncbi:YcnI family protein [Aeromicrobium duanguangcaii]|uniref:YcnI family copper-binding membrane protein n=1 Tax=Aeromicrobium duanguangcaii TaxID=2968086 RepID=UPI002017F534|nr:YcnI family protein [Aeromicrobium duanguangcaii]MCL3837343.1 YcnI family protein [Aeromicrobium duanguangcaii]
MSFAHHAARTAALTLGSSALVVAAAGAASAHVSVTPSSTAAGSYAVLTFSVGHGCGTSPTTRLAVQLPEQVLSVTPTVNPNWTVEKTMEKLESPASDGHGSEQTERVAEVVYTARTPLADGLRDTIALQLPLPEKEGEKLVFPVIQTCEEGETAWTQTYEEGQDEPESPAPFVVTTAAEGDGHGHGDAKAQEEPAEAGTGSDTLGWAGVALGALGLVAGGVALGRTRNRG